ncbi:aldo/keto reductase [Flavobacterium sp. WC2416]|uniref:Aldo/keto reductase n=1 Tax=Flavobacterium sp. WC2416 TaxID=3234141 RepID=A0AB39WJJ9_9FLAO
MKNIVLNNGVEMPVIGLGVYQVPDQQECEQTVYDAIISGYRLIDTAAAYMNEEAVGRAVKRSGVPREELFITTKLWIQDSGYYNAKRAFEKSLKKLQLDYLDLYLIHQPFGDIYGSWKAMEELYKEGKIRAIGVSNFYPDRLMDLMVHNEIIPAVNQIETHPYWQQYEAQEFMKEHGIHLQAWSQFAQDNEIFSNPLLSAVAVKYNKSVAQLILRWLTQRGISVIPKSVRKERILENINISDFEISDEDMETIKKLDTGKTTIFDHHDPAMVKFLGEFRFDI